MGKQTGHDGPSGVIVERNKTMARLILPAVAVVMMLTVTAVHAIPLSTLVATDGMIQVGDKQFTNFELHDTTAQLSTPADPGNLDVQGFTNGLGEHGLRISPFSVSIPQANSSGAFVFTLEYDVTVTDPLFLLHDVRHAFSTTSNRGGGLSVISQAGFPADPNASMQSVVGFGGTGEFIVDNVDEHEVFAHDVSSQHMLHNFEAHALTVNLTSQGGPIVLGAINTSPIDLTFSQTAIPEPATGLLVASGLAGLVLLRRSWQSIHIR
jgi:PEP-CTERM motif-containing protein